MILSNLSEIITTLIPFFRAAWIVTILIGAGLLILAFILRKNPARKISPWVAGGFGVLMIISSGVQLVLSL
ncbi:MAG: hypothetical protein FWE33_04890 [Defluviitaleaceae bacterium]|nr:hypothetical protein [Defluviitaleaceae bacterium]